MSLFRYVALLVLTNAVRVLIFIVSTSDGPPSFPLVDVHMLSTWNTHHSLETASTMTFRA